MLIKYTIVLFALLHFATTTKPGHDVERRSPSRWDVLFGKVSAPKAGPKPKPRPLPPKAHASNHDDTPGSLPPTRSEHLDPFYNAGDEVKSGLSQEIAEQALDSFIEWAQEQWAGPDVSQTPTLTVSSVAFDSLSQTAAAATAMPLTYYAVIDQWLPSKDVALELAARDDLRNYSHLLTPAEYSMYQDDPLCYFANVEEMHWRALEAAVADGPATTEAPSKKRNLQARAFSPGNMSLYTQLFAHVLQEQMADIHLAEPSASSGSATAMAVAETSCPGLSGINDGVGVTTSFRMLEVVQTSTLESGGSGSGSSSASTVSSGSSAVSKEMGFWQPLLLMAIVSFAGCHF